MLRVQFDSQIFEIQKRGGISKYFKDLINCAPIVSKEVDVQLLFKYIRTREFNSTLVKRVDLPYSLFKKTFSSLNKKIEIDDSAILHTTYYLKEHLPRSISQKYVVTIHDMIDEDYPHLVKPPPFQMSKEEYCRNAAGIICVSNNTKSRLLALYGNDLPPIEVIHHGINLEQNFSLINSLHRDPNFVYVGNRHGYKNALKLIAAVPLVTKQIRDFKLFFVGGEPVSKYESHLIEKLGISSYIQFCNLDNESLRNLYSRSYGYLSSSLEEGFGIPILESGVYGCIPILSDIEVYREICDDNAIYFDPMDSQAIANSISQSFLDKGSTPSAEALFKHVQKYDLRTQIDHTIDFYKYLEEV